MGVETALKTVAVMSIAEGTVFLYTKHVCRAFQNFRDQHLAWPGVQQCAFLSQEMSEWGFPGCISIGDGSYVFLVHRPRRNGYTFWCRKKCYAVYNSISTHLDCLWQIKTVYHSSNLWSLRNLYILWFRVARFHADSWVFKNSHLWKHKAEYFEEHEYILVDKGKSCCYMKSH